MKQSRTMRSALIFVLLCGARMGAQSGVGSFLVTNDDVPAPYPNTSTFYNLNADGTLGAKTSVATGGNGIGGGFFAANRVVAWPNGSDACVYVSQAGTGDIAGIDALTHAVTGRFYGSGTDSGAANGIGMVMNAHYLYASYSTSGTLGTFQVQTGCLLSFVSDVTAVGLNGGVVNGMAIRGNLMVVTYGDGSIESFNISGGPPVSNGDKQNSTGAGEDHLPNGVVITQDGRYAIFGDVSTKTTVEVSEVSGGKLNPTVAYALGPAMNSGSIRLSPDEQVLYISNNSSGQVTAAFFDKTTGKIRQGCTSAALKGFYKKFSYAGNIGLQLTTSHGGAIYVPEFGFNGGPSYVGMLQLTSTGTACTLAEAAGSPVTDPQTQAAALSLAVYPATPF